MYFTRLVEDAKLRDVGTILRESRYVIFLSLGAHRRRLSRRAEQALHLRAESLASPVVDCDRSDADWGDISEALAHFGRIVDGLDSSRPFVAAFECDSLRDSGAEFVPYYVAYVDAYVEGEPDDAPAFDEACLDAFGQIYSYALQQERKEAARAALARRAPLMNLLVSLVKLVLR